MGKITVNQIINYKKVKDVSQLITEKQFIELNKITLYYDTKTIKNRLQNIRDFIINNVETKWLGRLRIITNKLKNDVISEYATKIRYGNNWETKRNNLREKVRVNKDKFIEKYGEQIGLEKWKERNSKVISYGLNAAVSRYGEEEGRKRWEATLKLKVNTMAINKKIRPYRNGRTLSEYQDRYGVELGYDKWLSRNNKQSYRFSLQYYFDNYGEINGLTEWNNYCLKMEKTTLKSFILRYGVEEGTIRYNSFVSKIKYAQSVDFFIGKYGKDVGLIKYKEYLTSKISYFKDKYSKISQDLFWNIFSKLNNDDRSKCYFYELNDEYSFFVWENKMTIINVDFKLSNKIIEFDGDYWHSKPEQKEIDNRRDDFLVKKGYIVKRVKEGDYKNKKEIIINECLNFLKNDTNFE